MNDTTPQIKKIFHDKMMAKDGIARLQFGVSMFDTAKKLILASLPENISVLEEKKFLLKRLYTNDLTDDVIDMIVNKI